MEDRKADSRRLSQAIDSHDAEVALMSPDGEVCGQPLGWVSPEFLATMFVRVRDFTLPSGRIDFTPDALELFSEELKEEWSK
jgi:hypothetical protein